MYKYTHGITTKMVLDVKALGLVYRYALSILMYILENVWWINVLAPQLYDL